VAYTLFAISVGLEVGVLGCCSVADRGVVGVCRPDPGEDVYVVRFLLRHHCVDARAFPFVVTAWWLCQPRPSMMLQSAVERGRASRECRRLKEAEG